MYIFPHSFNFMWYGMISNFTLAITFDWLIWSKCHLLIQVTFSKCKFELVSYTSVTLLRWWFQRLSLFFKRNLSFMFDLHGNWDIIVREGCVHVKNSIWAKGWIMFEKLLSWCHNTFSGIKKLGQRNRTISSFHGKM